jgi:hypothetical protein
MFQSQSPKRGEDRKERFGCWKEARLASVRRVYRHGGPQHRVYRHGRQQDRVYHSGWAPHRFDRHPYRQDCGKGSRRTAPRRIQASRRPTLFAAHSVASVDDRIRSSSYVARCRTSFPRTPMANARAISSMPKASAPSPMIVHPYAEHHICWVPIAMCHFCNIPRFFRDAPQAA